MLARLIHSLEQTYWRRDTRRRVQPFAWGIEHLSNDGAGQDPRAFLVRYAERALAASDEFFAAGPAEWHQRHGNLLTFPSALQSAFPENDVVHAQVFESDSRERAVIVLPQWNAPPESHVNICRTLARFGITAVRLSLPYHDERKPAGMERADALVSPNVGLTLQASRQAVLDVRRLVQWLREAEGYRRLGILGTSIGSAIAFISLAHEPALQAGVFLHVSTYFADVVRTGLSTAHVWASLERQVTPEELRHYWAPISPYPYIQRLAGVGKQCLLVSGRYDPVFVPELSAQAWAAFDRWQIPYEKLVLPCGHYTLGSFPFSYWAGLRFVPFLRRTLA